MAGILNDIHPALKSLWDLENELRRAAQNAIFLRNDDAKKYMDEAQRHFQEALKALKGETPAKTDQPEDPTLPTVKPTPPPSSE